MFVFNDGTELISGCVLSPDFYPSLAQLAKYCLVVVVVVVASEWGTLQLKFAMSTFHCN